jgi:hypothetical protein
MNTLAQEKQLVLALASQASISEDRFMELCQEVAEAAKYSFETFPRKFLHDVKIKIRDFRIFKETNVTVVK